MKRVLRHFLVVLFVLVWIGAVVYPSPRPFIESLVRLRHPPVDASAVAGLATQLPHDYKAIEQFSTSYVDWQPAWKVYDLPWYFPTTSEVVADHAGDCQAQALLMASILEAKGMPYTLMYSFDHVWVDYPGRTVTALEDPATSFVSNGGGGWLGSLPKKFPIKMIVQQRIAFHWTPMPLPQKLLILLGSALIVGYGERRSFRRFKRLFWWPWPLTGSAAAGYAAGGRMRER